MEFREKTLSSGTKILLGKDENSNDSLMRKFRGKDNVILHTQAPGSPFCVIITLNPSKKEIYEAGAICAGYSQDWRDHKADVTLDVFTGKDAKKGLFMKPGTWKIKNSNKITINKKDIIRLRK